MVLSRPEGTTAYKQGAGEQLLGGLSQLLQTGVGTYAKHKQNIIARRAAANILGIPEDQVPLGITMQDVVDLQKEKFKAGLKPKKQGDIGKTLIRVLGGLEEPSAVISPEQIATLPKTRHIFEQPKQVTIPGPTIGGVPGMISGQATEMMETPTSQEIADTLRQKLGITQEEAQRKALGLPQKKVKSTITPSTAIGILADPIKSAQIKRMYPEFYKRLEEIAREATGASTVATEDNLIDTNW